MKRKTVEREQARTMRAQGKSYSEIKVALKVSKGTLSLWLHDMPLSEEQMRLVRDFSPKRIERYRATMRSKRNVRLKLVYEKAKLDVGSLSARELFLAGLFLYLGEGTKSSRGRVVLSNTNPATIKLFLLWLEGLGICRKDVRFRLHIYKDMNEITEICYWAKRLNVARKQFKPSYIKESQLSGITYKNGFGHGTCNASFDNMALWEYIMMSLKYIEDTMGV